MSKVEHERAEKADIQARCDELTKERDLLLRRLGEADRCMKGARHARKEEWQGDTDRNGRAEVCRSTLLAVYRAGSGTEGAGSRHRHETLRYRVSRETKSELRDAST